MIQVLWIDDQYDQMKSFIEDAAMRGFTFHAFKSAEEGLQFLETNLELIQAIVLDGVFFKYANQSGDSADERGIGHAIQGISRICGNTKDLTPIIYSGQASFTHEENSIITSNELKLFDKTDIDHDELLFEAILDHVGQSEDLTIRKEFESILDLASASYLGHKHFRSLLKLLRQIKSTERISSDEYAITDIRKLMESVFKKMVEVKMVPEGMSFNGIARFFNGDDWVNEPTFTPKVIGFTLYQLAQLVQDGSHAEANSEGGLKLELDDYIKTSSSDYLYRSMIHQFIDTLTWAKNAIDNAQWNPNSQFWKKKEHTGLITSINEKGWGTLESSAFPNIQMSVTKKDMEDNLLKEGDQVYCRITQGTKYYINEIEKRY
ncbi:hypothetical protein [Phaeocystidibacter luteus]|uniref:Uncharacterized protein n=1 Tax=Phaeocystidibacter luteus TaxID=911197 RepID=A0A6N6RGY1_9FLAO|nr:hypothetical protein [Phaeocystidibacter luteus]KAB2810003.1 hypothetical protein F8C67_08980 [Phaeocystidibacter luteus]